jgi:hypothetical protein
VLRKMFSTSPVSGIADLPAPVALCCHDAGAANLIAAWAAADIQREYRVCAEGPARTIFARALAHVVPMTLPDALDGAACVLSGSGWSSDLEHEARATANRLGIPTLAVLDHWVNYRMRFVRNGAEVLPDVFVVTDPEAAAIATATFGDLRPIVIWPNRYLEHEVARVRSIATHAPASQSLRLLVVLEPIREDWITGATEPAEFRALSYLMENLHLLTLQPQDMTVRLRPHPSELVSKYRHWVDQQAHTRLEFSQGGTLAEDLAWADAVAGLHSYALVVACAAQRRAVSYLPPDAPPCALRYPGIERMADIAGRQP